MKLSDEFVVNYEKRSLLTDADSSKESDTLIRWFAFRKKGFAGINGKGQSHYSLTAGSNNDTLNP